jgi:hypothetical protein
MVGVLVSVAGGATRSEPAQLWVVSNGETSSKMTSIFGGKLWTYVNVVSWHEYWNFSATGGTTGWAEPGSWVRVSAHSFDDQNVVTAASCTDHKQFTSGSAYGAVEPALETVNAHESKLTWETAHGVGLCSGPSGWVPAKGLSAAVFYATYYQHSQLVNLSHITANGDDWTYSTTLKGKQPGAYHSSIVLTDDETLRLQTHKP